MIVTHKLSVDLAEKGKPIVVNGVHGDSARALELELLTQGAPWQIPQEVAVCIRYEKADGTGGSYDTLPDGTKAWGVWGNTLFLVLAPQVCTVRGPVTMQVSLLLDQLQISTFPMVLQVERELSGEGDSEDYTNLAAWLAEFGAAGGQHHVLDKDNPHGVTKEQLGLELVDNTADMDKPLSTASQKYVDLRTNDFIIAQGVSGIWTYRKWQSGMAEMWTDYYSTNHTDETGLALPFPLISHRIGFASSSWASNETLANHYACGVYENVVRIFARTVSGAATTNCGCRVLAIGAWKELDFSCVSVQDYVDAQLEGIENGTY